MYLRENNSIVSNDAHRLPIDPSKDSDNGRAYYYDVLVSCKKGHSNHSNSKI